MVMQDWLRVVEAGRCLRLVLGERREGVQRWRGANRSWRHGNVNFDMQPLLLRYSRWLQRQIEVAVESSFLLFYFLQLRKKA